MGQPGTDRFSIGVNGKKLFDSRAQEADEVALADGVTGRVDQPRPDRVACEGTAGDAGATRKGIKFGQLGARQVDSEGQSRHHCAPGKIARRTGQYAIPLRDTAQELVSRFRGRRVRDWRTVPMWNPLCQGCSATTTIGLRVAEIQGSAVPFPNG